MFDDVEGLDLELPVYAAQFEGLEGALPDVNAPDGLRFRHSHSSLDARESIRRRRNLNNLYNNG